MKIGQKAPEFSTFDDSGKETKLSDFKGRKVVLYFYPKDDTPGCTREACNFRDGLGALSKAGAVVLGVSADSVNSHGKFRDKYQLNFPLLADTDRTIVEDYGVWKEKTNYGKTYMGIERTTYIIDEEGKISHVFPKVKVDGHYEEVLAALKA